MQILAFAPTAKQVSTSLLFGSEGMSTITVPTLILAGSQDIIVPTVPNRKSSGGN